MGIGLISHDVLEAAESFALTGLGNIGSYLLANPVISIFLCLALGYMIGQLKIKSFSVGATVGTLVVGLLLSLALSGLGTYDISSSIKTIFFSLFIFAIGYEVGPAFFESLRTSGVKVVIMSLVFAAAAFAVALALFKVFKIAPGEAGGILAGALTQSAVLGTADATLKSLMTGDALSDAESQLAIAYALTYVFGTMGVVVFLRNIAPAMLGVKLQDAAKEKIEKTGFQESGGGDGVVSALRTRAFVIGADAACIGKTVGEREEGYGNKLSVEKLIRGGKEIPVTPDITFAAGDTVTIIGTLDAVLAFDEHGMTETADSAALTFSAVQKQVMLTKNFSADTIKTLAEQGVVITKATRGGKAIPAGTAYEPKDELVLTGPKAAVAKAAKTLGYIKDTGTATDVSFLSWGIVAGLIIGAICFTVKGIPITLGSGGGALVAGLLFGNYQASHADKGLIPTATRWFCKSVGLNLFIAIVGLTAGSKFLSALQSMGFGVLLLGAVITLAPHIIAMLFGKYILKMDAVDIIGGLCGAGTCTAALNGVVEEAGTSIFALAYTPGYAMGNILITVLGPLLVALLV